MIGDNTINISGIFKNTMIFLYFEKRKVAKKNLLSNKDN